MTAKIKTIKKGIDSIFTTIVTDYIVNEYVINTETMSGNQGEIGKVDLRKGDEIIRVFLQNEFDSKNEFRSFIGLTVGKAIREEWNRNTIWNSDLEVVKTFRFYKVEDNLYEADDIPA